MLYEVIFCTLVLFPVYSNSLLFMDMEKKRVGAMGMLPPNSLHQFSVQYFLPLASQMKQPGVIKFKTPQWA